MKTMEYVSNTRLEDLEVMTNNAGATGDLSRLKALIMEFSTFTMTYTDGILIAEGISISKNGRFFCAIVDTREENSVRWIKHNMEALKTTNIGQLSELAENMRRLFHNQADPVTA